MHIIYDARARQRATPGAAAAASNASGPRVITARISTSVPDGSMDCAGTPVVPHIVRPLGGNGPWTLDGPNLRSSLHIPLEATVFCRYGGRNAFSRLLTREGLIAAAAQYPRIYFLFMNTNPCHAIRVPSGYHQCIPPTPNVIFLNATADSGKPTFIRTCDAMLHGRENGEMFGLALAEFSVMHRPNFTSGPKAPHLNARAHLDILGEKAFVHHNKVQLVQQIRDFDRKRAAAMGEYWDAYQEYAPQRVMRAFECVFLRGRAGAPCHEAGSGSGGGNGDESCTSCRQQYTLPRVGGCTAPSLRKSGLPAARTAVSNTARALNEAPNKGRHSKS